MANRVFSVVCMGLVEHEKMVPTREHVCLLIPLTEVMSIESECLPFSRLSIRENCYYNVRILINVKAAKWVGMST